MAKSKLEDFDLSSKVDRYRARQLGFDVPKRIPGMRRADFWTYVEKSDGCWIWKGNVNADGYGFLCIHKRTTMAHRHAWELAHGKKLLAPVAMHTCDNPRCVNPDHIKPGTQAENMMDKVAKNRQAKGERNAAHRLTEAQVAEMRSKYSARNVTYAALAREYGVCKDTAQKAIRGIHWQHV